MTVVVMRATLRQVKWHPQGEVAESTMENYSGHLIAPLASKSPRITSNYAVIAFVKRPGYRTFRTKIATPLTSIELFLEKLPG